MDQLVMKFNTAQEHEDVVVEYHVDGEASNYRRKPIKTKLLELMGRQEAAVAGDIELTVSNPLEDPFKGKNQDVLVRYRPGDGVAREVHYPLKGDVITLLIWPRAEELIGRDPSTLDPKTHELQQKLIRGVLQVWVDSLAAQDPAAAAPFLADLNKVEHILPQTEADVRVFWDDPKRYISEHPPTV